MTISLQKNIFYYFYHNFTHNRQESKFSRSWRNNYVVIIQKVGDIETAIVAFTHPPPLRCIDIDDEIDTTQ